MKGILIFCALMALLMTNCLVTPLYERATIGNGWHRTIGCAYYNAVLSYIDPGDNDYYGIHQGARFDYLFSYDMYNKFALIPRVGFGFLRYDDLRANYQSRDETKGLIDAGLGVKLGLTDSPKFCMSLKYDLGLMSLGTLGTAYLLAGIKQADKEVVTLSLFTGAIPVMETKFLNNLGISIAWHDSPVFKTTLVAGSTFFFTAEGTPQHDYRAFWLGLGYDF